MKKHILIITILAIYALGCKKFDRVTAVLTLAPTEVSSNSANLKLLVLDVGDENIIGIDYGETFAPTTGKELSTTFQQGDEIAIATNNLKSATKYYVRAWVRKGNTKEYSKELTFMTENALKDVDGYIYNTIVIGKQTWMKENLMVTHSPNNASITTYNPDNNAANVPTYGRLYDWNTAMNGATTEGAQGICPTGWHIPTSAEWTTLSNYLGGDAVAVGKMKEVGTIHWLTPNTGATNESGFTALPSGHRDKNALFYELGLSFHFWSSSQNTSSDAWYRSLYINSNSIVRYYYDKTGGFSVRCIKNQ